MKKILSLALVLSMLLCFAACQEEEKGDVYYLYELTDSGETITASQLAAEMQAEGMNLNEMFYLRLYKDGRGVLCRMGEETKMKRDTTHIWPEDDETAKMAFTLEGDTLTIQDGAAVMVFKKN